MAARPLRYRRRRRAHPQPPRPPRLEAISESDEVLAERAELVARLRRLTPAWGELRAVLNELNSRLEP